MDFTDVEQAPYITTQTATVSDEAVQAFKQEFHENSPKRSYDENIKSALTAAAPYLTASVEVGDDLDTRLKAAGMYTVEEIMAGTPVDKWRVHSGMDNLSFFGEWLERKAREYKVMAAGYDIGDKDKNDELYEWALAHSGAFHDVLVNFRSAIRALSPAEPVDQWQDMKVLSELSKLTYAVQHNPNCPDRYLVRLPGKAGIDLKPYGNAAFKTPNQTNDILGFGKTLHEAYIAATAAPASKGGE